MELLLELNKFSGITFIEEDHSYFYNGKRCTSVTSLVSKFQKPFDDIIAVKYAKKHGLDVGYVRNMWKENGEETAFVGSEVHKYAENIFFSKHYTPEWNPRTEVLCRMIDKFHDDSRLTLIPIRAELIIGDEALGLCGMIDKLFYNTVSKEIEIWDYKTSKKIDRYSTYKKFFTNRLSHLQDCEFVKFSLQLSAYKKIIEKNTNIKIGNSYICWINEVNDTYKVIKTDFLEREVDIMFNSLIAA